VGELRGSKDLWAAALRERSPKMPHIVRLAGCKGKGSGATASASECVALALDLTVCAMQREARRRQVDPQSLHPLVVHQGAGRSKGLPKCPWCRAPRRTGDAVAQALNCCAHLFCVCAGTLLGPAECWLICG
jgi:hypothetical protein